MNRLDMLHHVFKFSELHTVLTFGIVNEAIRDFPRHAILHAGENLFASLMKAARLDLLYRNGVDGIVPSVMRGQ